MKREKGVMVTKSGLGGGIREKREGERENHQKGECRDQDGCSNAEVPIC